MQSNARSCEKSQGVTIRVCAANQKFISLTVKLTELQFCVASLTVKLSLKSMVNANVLRKTVLEHVALRVTVWNDSQLLPHQTENVYLL